MQGRSIRLGVVPAKAGTQYPRALELITSAAAYWIPAFAGMTAAIEGTLRITHVR
jgi:hypothetical protein